MKRYVITNNSFVIGVTQATGLGHCVLKNLRVLQLFVTFIILLFNTVLSFHLLSVVLMDLINLLDVGLVNC